jgi:hypothetical protein
MFPWVHGFHWTAGHIVFLSLFGLVALTIAVTLVAASWRAWGNLRTQRAAALRWHEDFHDLSKTGRACRHQLTGEMKGRVCDQAFDCRGCEQHAKWIVQHPVTAAQDSQPFGLDFPPERFYHRGHTWVEVQADGNLLVGLDDFGHRLIGQPDAVKAPAPGTRLEANGPAWTVRRKGTSARILSPVDGTVLYAGQPSDRFVLLVRPPEGGADLRHLLFGAEVKPWLSRELERLQVAISGPLAGPSLADGGVLVDDLPAGYPQADWDAAWGQAFLEP